MSVRLTDDGQVALYGDCPSADAETLLAYLSEAKRTVDWRTCNTAHTAVVQVLVVSQAKVLGPPLGAFLRQFVEPALRAQYDLSVHETTSVSQCRVVEDR